MVYALRFSCHSFGLDSRRNSIPAPVHRFQIRCKSSLPHSAGAQDSQSLEDDGDAHLILLEKYGNGTSKRYVVEGDSQIRTILEEPLPGTKVLRDSYSMGTDKALTWLPKVIKDFVLPAGFPDSVSDDYLEYILLQFPTNVTGWICHTLVTSSLLQAVGVGSLSGTAAAASAAAIRWVSKDGIGAVGRLFIGGRFGNLLTMIQNSGACMQTSLAAQEGFASHVLKGQYTIFDLSTQLYPAYFLPLASLGNLAKAVGRGLRDPSFRVIQNHFAISGNLGEVSAKEEVWEVAAELVGLALGILALDTPGISSSYPVLASTWLATRLLHLWFRYLSLSVLRFNTINLKRARILVNSHILYRKVPGISDCNRMENILVWERFLRPRITFGVTLEEMVTGKKRGSMVRMLLELYEEEKYFLVVNQVQTEFEVFVSFKGISESISTLSLQDCPFPPSPSPASMAVVPLRLHLSFTSLPRQAPRPPLGLLLHSHIPRSFFFSANKPATALGPPEKDAILNGTPPAHYAGEDSVALPEGMRRELMPRHVAVIMDGNRRWARMRGLPTGSGYEAGARAFRRIVGLCCNWGIRVLTVFAFSSDNWFRPKIPLRSLGAFEMMPVVYESAVIQSLCRFMDQVLLADAMETTINNSKLHLIIAVNYSGQNDIVQACQKLAVKVKDGLIEPEEINEFFS
ncbi:UNVERIFIED_CONTAM: protein root UVB sensitive 5 [Sesamum angustifolium]|uniref:Protein root UVB sensitive 5 n=1 Tax=Sesamum angustifolium TaxID=2727405 RepID=A0AAW2N3Z6_9LAMI